MAAPWHFPIFIGVSFLLFLGVLRLALRQREQQPLRATALWDHDYVVTGELTIRGVTRSVPLKVSYLGQWQTPWWEKEGEEWVDKGPKLRAGFVATTEINRHDFGVSWSETLDKGGVVVGDKVSITIDAEAVWESD